MTYDELIAQRAHIDQQIAKAVSETRKEAVATARELVKKFGISSKELFGKPNPTKGKALPPKYRDPATGKTWSGRGIMPTWLRELDTPAYLIK